MVAVNGQLRNAQLEKLEGDPESNEVEGRIYYDTESKKARIFDGTNWGYIGGGEASALAVFANDAAFESAKGSAAAAGDAYFNSTELKAKIYDGTSWSLVGSGSSSGLNLIGHPSDAVGWTETGSVFATPVTTTTAGDLPLGGVVGTAIQLVATDSGAEASNYCSFEFTTPASLAEKLPIEFYLRPGSGFANSEWTVSIYQGSTRQTLPIDASGVTYLVNAAGKSPPLSFDCLASTTYTLRFARVSGSGSATLNVAGVFVGPGKLTQGAVVGDWQSFSPTTTWVSNTTAAGIWRRVGSSMEVRYYLTLSGAPTSATLGLTIPNGLNIDTAALGGSVVHPVGYAFASDASPGANYTGEVYVNSSTVLRILTHGSNVGSGWNQANPVTFASGDYISVWATVPIAEWAGSGTVNLASPADVEYASVGGTWDADGSTTVYGPSGSAVGGTLTAARSKTVTWQYPIQVGDKIDLEFSSDQLNWYPAIGFVTAAGAGPVSPIMFRTSSVRAGVAIRQGASATQSIVQFQQYMVARADGTSDTNWPSSGMYWRLRKSSAAAAVGFGLATETASGLVPSFKESIETLTYGGLTTSPTTTAVIQRIGNTVHLTVSSAGSIYTKDGSAGTVSLSTLPSWARPASAAAATSAGYTSNPSSGTGANFYSIGIATSGVITFSCGITTGTASNFASGGNFRNFSFTTTYSAV